MTMPAALPPNTPAIGLSRKQAAVYVGVGVDLFDTLVKNGGLPQPVRLGSRLVWDRRRLDAAFDKLQGLSPALTGGDDVDPFLEDLNG